MQTLKTWGTKLFLPQKSRGLFAILQTPAVDSPECGRRTRFRPPQATKLSRINLHITRNLFMQSKHINHPCPGRKLAKNIAGFRRNIENLKRQLPSIH